VKRRIWFGNNQSVAKMLRLWLSMTKKIGQLELVSEPSLNLTWTQDVISDKILPLLNGKKQFRIIYIGI